MELASLQVNTAASPDKPLVRYTISAPILDSSGEAVCGLAQVRWRDGVPRGRETLVRGENEMQALCLAIRLMISEIETLVKIHGPLVHAGGVAFDPNTLGLQAIPD